MLPHLEGANIELAPSELVDYAKGKGASNVYFVDDTIKCKRSIRLMNYLDKYKMHILGCDDTASFFLQNSL